MNISRFSVSQPVLVNVVVILVLLAGGYSYMNITQEVMPQIPLKIATVATTYQGASPEEVEDLVTVPIEERVRNLSEIDFVQATSVQGRSQLVIQFEHHVDNMTEKMQNLRQEVDIAQADLPDDADDPIVQKEEFTVPVMNVGLSGDYHPHVIRDEAERLESRLQRIDGVVDIRLTGVEDYEIRIHIDPARMEQYGLDVQAITQRLRNENINLPAGTIQDQQGEMLALLDAEFLSIRDIRNTTVTRAQDGSRVKIRDIATRVEKTFEERSFLSRVNGKSSAVIQINKSADGDTIQIVEDVKQLLDAYRQETPEGISTTIMNDRSRYVETRLNTINTSLVWGLLLVLTMLMVFLDWRIALLAALGIPFALGFAMIIHYMSGGTANMIALFSFLVVLGVIVDDKIIIAENCFRHLEKGMHPIRAAVVGTTEVFWPVVIAILTNIAAFSPLLLVEGRIGSFTMIIPMIAIFAFIGSLFEAFFILPSHIADFVRNPSGERNRPVLDRIIIVYRYILKNMLRFRYFTIPFFLLISAGTIYFAVTYMDVVFFNMDYLDYYRIELETDRDNALEDTEEVVKRIENRVQSGTPDRGLKSITSIIGRSAADGGIFETRSNLAVVNVELTEAFAEEHARAEIFRQARNFLEGIEGVKRLRLLEQQGGPPQGQDIDVDVSGPNLQVAREIAQKGQETLSAEPGVSNLQTDYVPGKRRLRIQPDRTRASFHGINTRQIALAVQGYFDGTQATTVRWEEESLDVMVETSGEKGYSPARLRQVTVNSPGGVQIPLDYLIRTEWDRGPSARTRMNGQPTVNLTGEVDTTVTTIPEVTQRLRNRFQEVLQKYPGYDVNYEGGEEDIDLMVRSLSRAGLLALLLIFLLMGALFRNLIHPLAIMITVPFCLIGIILGMLVSQEPLSFMALMGTVAVAGVVVNDSMILIHFANQQRKQGRGLLYSLMKAGCIRFRPVILTTITTVAGLLPLLLWVSGQEEMLMPMALAIAWGMAFGTVLTLLLIPAMYFIGEEVYAFFGWNSLHHQTAVEEHTSDLDPGDYA